MVLLHPFLYRTLKLTFPTDVGRIVLDGPITSDVNPRSLGLSVGVLSDRSLADLIGGFGLL